MNNGNHDNSLDKRMMEISEINNILWHTTTIDEAATQLDSTTVYGLTDQEAKNTSRPGWFQYACRRKERTFLERIF